MGAPGRGGDSSSWLPAPNTICLMGSLLGRTTIPYSDRVPSYLLIGRKFGHRGSLFISLVFCRIILIAGWYCNLKVPSSGQCSSSASGYCGHSVAQKNFKRLLRARGSNSFQLSRMHLKGVCREVDWLFPI